MGNTPSKSSTQNKYQQTQTHIEKSDSYSVLSEAKIIASKSKYKHTSIRKPPFAATWSLETPENIDVPTPRQRHFSTRSYSLNLGVIGFGIDKDDNLLEDMWTYDLSKLSWKKSELKGAKIPPRTGSRATFDKQNNLYVFGGANGDLFFNDIYKINIISGECIELDTTGDVPSPRNSPLLAHYDGKLFVWGGYDGGWPSDLYSLELSTNVWTKYQQPNVKGKTGTSFTIVDSKIYCYASAKRGGIYQIDLATNVVSQLKTYGEDLDQDIMSAALFYIDNYLILIGGKNQPEYVHVYACNLNRLQWFIFHVVPDLVTVTEHSGQLDKNYDFLIPRISSVSISYSKKKRSILTVLGNPMIDPPPFNVLYIGEALSQLHLRDDMMSTLVFPPAQKVQRI